MELTGATGATGPTGSSGTVVYGVIVPNQTVASVNESLPTGYNGQSIGPITINTGVTITVASGQKWVILNY
jgi:hypothetical protein